MQGMLRTWIGRLSAGNLVAGAIIGFLLGHGMASADRAPETAQLRQPTVAATPLPVDEASR